MILPLSWLKEYVDVDVTPDELEKKLFDAGFEVEEKYELGRDVSNIVVGLTLNPVNRFLIPTFMCVRSMQAHMARCRYAVVQTMSVQVESSR